MSARYSIGQLCDEFGVTPRALRFYETHGLLRPERRGQARLYSETERARLALVLRGKRVGFALSEIKELLDLEELHGGDREALACARDRFVEKIEALRRQREDIDHAIVDLEAGRDWLEARLEQREPDEGLRARAAALEALARSYLSGDGVGAAAE